MPTLFGGMFSCAGCQRGRSVKPVVTRSVLNLAISRRLVISLLAISRRLVVVG